MIRFACPNCETALQVPAGWAGRKITCPQCRQAAEAPETLNDEAPTAERDEEVGQKRLTPTRKKAAESNPEQQEAVWYYSIDGSRRGPVSKDDLRSLVADGKLKPSDLVWRRGMERWIPAAEVAGLFPEDLPPPLPEDEPPPLPRKTARQKTWEAEEPIITWEAWQVWVFSIITLGFFGFYLIPSWAKSVERITGKPRMPFGAVLTLGICTFGLALLVIEVVYAFDLAKHGERTGRVGSHRQLGGWVLAFNAVGLVWSVATSGIGFLLGGAAMGILATWLVQAEINGYAQDERG